MRKAILALGMIVLVGGLLAWQGAAIPPLTEQTSASIPDASKQQVLATYARLPLSFEANQGQSDEQVKFLSRGRGYSLFLTSTEAVLSLISPQNAPSAQRDIPTLYSAASASSAVSPPKQESAVLRMRLVGVNPAPQVVGLGELPGKSNYFIGNDPEKWRTNVAQYRKVKYRNVYPGIDLVYYGTNQRQLEYDFIVAPGHDPKAIALKFEGADNLEVDAQGDLLVHLGDEEVRFQKPYVYQESSEARQEIAGGYLLKDKDEVAFEVASYDATKPLIIDPVLTYSTYIGGSGDETIGTLTVDEAGNFYKAGTTSSADFPTESPFQAANGGNIDAYVTKLNPEGSALVYSTYLGGSGDDTLFRIAVDVDGNAYVTGNTSSTDFPTEGPFQATNGGGPTDAFVTKLNATGSGLVWSTYVGGSGSETGQGIAVDDDGNTYVSGPTSSTDFPTANPLQAVSGGDQDAFVIKLNPAGSALVYATYLGGSGADLGNELAIDAAGNAYVTGQTDSTDFPTLNPLQAVPGGNRDAFVTKLNAAGSMLLYSTYLGGSDLEFSFDIAVDGGGNAYVTGRTRSTDFPVTAGAFQTSKAGGGTDVLVTKLNASGSELVYSTYLGGTRGETAFGIAVDTAGNAYVAGVTTSTDFPTANPFQATNAGGGDGFVTKLNANGSALVYSTYLGGSGRDVAIIAPVAFAGNAYVTGDTTSLDFPTVNPLQAANAGGNDNFVAKIAPLDIDIKPRTDPNTVNPSSHGVLVVAILTTDAFAAQTVSPITVRFGPDGASIAHSLGHLTDVDNDGDLDLLLHFPTQDTGIQCGDTEASLSGQTFDGGPFQASDSIVTVGCN